MSWGAAVRSCYELGWTWPDVLAAPAKEIFRCQQTVAVQHVRNVNRDLMLVNTVRSALGADPIDPIGGQKPRKKKSQESAADFMSRVTQMQ